MCPFSAGRFSKTAFNTLISLCFTVFFTTAARAEKTNPSGWDLALTGAARTLPFGGAVWAESGFGKLLWGSKEGLNGNPGWRYGYVRPYGRFQTSVLVTRADLGVDLYPVSLLGISVGVADSQRFLKKSHTGDCVATDCSGNLARVYLRTRAVAGFGPAFFSFTSRLDAMSHSNKTLPYTEEGTVIVGNAGGDSSYSNELAVGFKFWEVWAMGLRYSSSKMLGSGSRNSQEDLFVRWKNGDYTVFAGSGFYTSTTCPRSFTAYALFQWTVWPTLGL